MGWTKRWWKRIRALVRKEAVERELDEELAFHLEMETEKYLREGMSPKEARRMAAVAFGGVERYKEQVRSMRAFRVLEDLGLDLRYGFRRLARAPGFSLAVILCLGLGMGATAGVFSFFFGIVVRPLPFTEPDRLTVLFETAPGFTRASPSHADFEGWRENASAFAGLGAYVTIQRTFTGNEEPEILDGTRVSHDLFGILGVQPQVGRGFTLEDDGPAAPPTLILSERLWLGRFGGRQEIVGSTVLLDGAPHVVIGVMPRGFAFPDEASFWVPLRTSVTPNTGSLTAVLGRLRESVTLEAAQDDMARISALMQEAYPEANAQREIAVRSLEEDFLWGMKTPATLFLLVAGFVLLLAAANVANLLLAQGTAREAEMVVRTALGAGRSRVFRQLLAESFLLSLAAGALGTLLGILGRNLYLSFLPEAYPYYLGFEVDAPVLAILFAVTLGTAFLVGLAPAHQSTRLDLFAALRVGGEEGGSVRKAKCLRPVLMAVQTGLALVVLIGAGMMAMSLDHLYQVSSGLTPENLLTMQISLSKPFREDPDRQRTAFDEIRDRTSALPVVRSAAVVSNLPIGGAAAGTSLYAEGTVALPPGQEPWVINKTVQPGYFETMGIRLIRGRDFRERDGAEGTVPVVIVNESFSRWHWPDENPLGKRIKYGRPESDFPWMEVVGVAADVRHFGLDRPVELGIYEPFRHFPYWREYLVVRTSGDPGSVVASLRQTIHDVDPGAPVSGVLTMEEVLFRSYWRPVVLSRLLWIFSGLALALAVLGVYGVVAFSMAQRTREFGVRIALGAPGGVILLNALRGVALPCSVGLLGGLALAFGGMRFAASFMYGVETLDPRVAVAAFVFLGGTAVGAAYFPARRAAAVDPVAALNSE
jgi:predicted permease